jgi:SAM-dependent methyltransferase
MFYEPDPLPTKTLFMPSTNVNTAQDFLLQVSASLQQHNLVKLLLSKYRGNDKELQRLTIRPVELRNETALSCVYSYKTRDITKNLAPAEALELIDELLQSDFKSAHLLTETLATQLTISKKGKVSISNHKPQQSTPSSQQHNREKKRFVDIQRPFLTALGVTDQQQQLIPSMSRKWKQINKFIEVFSQALESSPAPKDKALQVVDFGSGKGYLTFAIHDYLRHSLGNVSQVTGVELRQQLADLCNTAAKNLEHGGLDFVCGDVKTHAPNQTDVMIALHACDIATDYAINYGIQAGASIIMCSPCCHKQIRPQMQSPDLFKPMLQYGVHLGQEAEMVTDSLRALLLEANGYSTKVFEFISLEHTNKNKMILAVKRSKPLDNTEVLQQIAAIKTFYGISEHCLESLLAQ